MLLKMEPQQTTASFISSLQISPFSLQLEQQQYHPTSPALGQPNTNVSNNTSQNCGGNNSGSGSSNANTSSSNNNDNNNNTNNSNENDPTSAYAAYGLHLGTNGGGGGGSSSGGGGGGNETNTGNNTASGNNTANNSATSNTSHHHHQPQQQHLHQQQQQQHYQQQQQQPQPQQLQQQQQLAPNYSNLSYSYIYNFDSQYIFPTGYQENTSSNSQQSVNGGNGGGGGGSTSATSGCGNNSYAVIQGGSNSNVSNNVGGNGSGGGGGSGGVGNGNNYMTLLPPAVGSASSSGHMSSNQSGTSASAGVSSDIIDFKHLFEELCPVCGDKVSGYHYGLLTCESCKGFFKRTVQNKKVYTCVAERSCHIDKTQRKRCPYCRFQKCLEVGMKLEAVRADRMRGGRNKFGPMYKRDRARKLQLMRQRQLALQALRTMGSADIKPTPVSIGYQQGYPNMNIKQEIQIPQVSSLTQSPDSSPSPIAIALGQVNASTGVIATPNNAGTSGGVNNNSSSGNSGNTSSENVNRGSASGCQDDGIGSLHNASESKICFDSGTHPSSTADSMIEPLRVSPMIRDFVQSIDDREWQTQLFALLQKQTYNQVEVDLFELLCKVLDQNLFSQVDWARNTVFFKDLKVDDQMKLLQHSWSDMLVLDHLHQRIHNGLPDETQLNNGQVFNLLSLGLLGVPQLSDFFNELQNKLQDLKFDMGDYVCMKFLILLNPDVRGIINKKTVLEGHENVQAALLDYTLTCYPSVTDKFRRLLNILPEIHAMAARGEEHLYSKHCAGSAPTQTLLMEMLHAKRKV